MLSKDKFYTCYHKTYPKNIIALYNLFDNVNDNKVYMSKHMKAIYHFLHCLAENESGFVYGMLCNAFDKLLDEIKGE